MLLCLKLYAERLSKVTGLEPKNEYIMQEKGRTKKGQGQSGNIAQQLGFEDEFPFFVLFRRLKRLVIFPTHRFFALMACDVTDDVPAGGHVTFIGVPGIDIDDTME